jgi:hypothetical protein
MEAYDLMSTLRLHHYTIALFSKSPVHLNCMRKGTLFGLNASMASRNCRATEDRWPCSCSFCCHGEVLLQASRRPRLSPPEISVRIVIHHSCPLYERTLRIFWQGRHDVLYGARTGCSTKSVMKLDLTVALMMWCMHCVIADRFIFVLHLRFQRCLLGDCRNEVDVCFWTCTAMPV